MPLTKESRDIMLDGILEKSINAPLSRALEFYKNISDDFVGSIEATGVRFAEEYEGLADADRLHAQEWCSCQKWGRERFGRPLEPGLHCVHGCLRKSYICDNEQLPQGLLLLF